MISVFKKNGQNYLSLQILLLFLQLKKMIFRVFVCQNCPRNHFTEELNEGLLRQIFRKNIKKSPLTLITSVVTMGFRCILGLITDLKLTSYF